MSWFVVFWRDSVGDSDGSGVINDVFDFGASAFGASEFAFPVLFLFLFSGLFLSWPRFRSIWGRSLGVCLVWVSVCGLCWVVFASVVSRGLGVSLLLLGLSWF